MGRKGGGEGVKKKGGEGVRKGGGEGVRKEGNEAEGAHDIHTSTGIALPANHE